MENKEGGGVKLFKSPCRDLRELISELEDCGGRPRQKSLLLSRGIAGLAAILLSSCCLPVAQP